MTRRVAAADTPAVSVVVPVHDNATTLDELVGRVVRVLQHRVAQLEVLLVDDASRDGSWSKIQVLSSADRRVRGIALDRNVGNLTARAIGCDEATGGVICTLDADLENAPEDLPRLVERIVAGADLVSGVRRDQRGRPAMSRLGSLMVRQMVDRTFGYRPGDFGCGMKAFAAPLAAEVGRRCGDDPGMRWAVELFRSARRYEEVEVRWVDRGRRSGHGLVTRARMTVALVVALRGMSRNGYAPNADPLPQQVGQATPTDPIHRVWTK